MATPFAGQPRVRRPPTLNVYKNVKGVRWPPLRWPGVAIEPLSRFCQKRMLIQIVPRPQGFSPMIEGVRWPPLANEGVAIETPRL
jgi:hypothetical protein